MIVADAISGSYAGSILGKLVSFGSIVMRLGFVSNFFGCI